LLGALLQSTSPIRLSDVAAHPSSVGFPQNHPPMRSFLGVPIRRGSVTIGSLYLAERDGGGEFTTEDEAAVQALGAYAGIAVHNLHMLAKQRSLVNGLINAQEEERRAVAYDLHDGLTQYVMAAHAHLETHRRALEDGDEARASRESETGIRYLKEAVIESRRLISGLRTLALDDVGLAGALDQLVQEEKDRAGWKEADFDQNLGRRRFGYPLETAAYRIAQEALTNARKHAGAGHVEVRLLLERSEYSSGERLRLSVSDDGEGFVVESKAGDYSRVGLHGMAERARILDAEFEVRSAPGEGTRVAVTFPVTPDAAG
jgi:signal transduction histidine kinase